MFLIKINTLIFPYPRTNPLSLFLVLSLKLTEKAHFVLGPYCVW